MTVGAHRGASGVTKADLGGSLAMPPICSASDGLGALEVRWTTALAGGRVLLLCLDVFQCLLRNDEAATTS